MFSNRSYTALSSAERQWLRSRPGARCVHTSRPRRVDKGSDNNSVDPSTPYNAPKRGPTRHQRAAQISNEISMLQKGPPPSGDLTGPGSVTGAYHAPPQAPNSSAGFLETPDDMSGSRMGENVSAGREGPNAQGIGRPARYEDRGDAPQDNTIMARAGRSPSNVEEPAEGGASVLGGDKVERGHHMEWVERSGRADHVENEGVWSKGEESSLRKKLVDTLPLGVQYKPVQPDGRDLLQNGRGTSIILGGNFDGVINDRIRALSKPTSPENPMTERKWKDFSKSVKWSLVNKMVAGQYDRDGLMGGGKYKQPVLDEIAKKTMLNGSYLQADAERVLKKVQSLLPAVTTGAAAKEQQKQQARK